MEQFKSVPRIADLMHEQENSVVNLQHSNAYLSVERRIPVFRYDDMIDDFHAEQFPGI